MQKIFTEDLQDEGGHDFYIDNMPGKQFGYFYHPDARPGFNWKEYVGRTVHGASVIEHDGYQWLNKSKGKGKGKGKGK